MKRKGFTLVELLAVIVILAVIALITVPMIMNVIEKARKEAVKDTVYGYIEAIETSIIVNTMMESGESMNDLTCSLLEDDLVCINNLSTEIKVKGDKLDELIVSFASNGTIESAEFKKNQYCGIFEKGQQVEIVTCGEEKQIDSAQVNFTPTDSTWNVNSVEEALDDLYNR